MRILIAPDSFKESMSSTEAAHAIARGLRKALGDGVELDLCPMADGGEGIMDALVGATRGIKHKRETVGPLGDPIGAEWGMLSDKTTAVVEVAQAAGLALVPPQKRDPTRTTTLGVGLLMGYALEAGATKIIVGLGGSATNDGGCGVAAALGVARFADLQGRAMVKRIPTGGTLHEVAHVEIGRDRKRMGRVEIIAACDVTNPLFGPDGAAYTFATQKGATPEQVVLLDRGLAHLASLIPHVNPLASGMGAAGGLGFGLTAFCNAKLVRGIELVMEAVGFDERLRRADLVITGEGRLDGQSLRGKACIGIAQAAAKQGVKAVALVGSVGPDAERSLDLGLASYHPIVGGKNEVTASESMRRGPELLENLATILGRSFS